MARLLLALVMCLGWVQISNAHEVQSAIADFVTENGQFRMEMRLGAEPLVAGVDLAGVDDTNATDKADVVDALRALEPDAFESEIRAALPRLLSGMNVRSGDVALDLTADAIEIPPVGNIELPRETVLKLSGALPPGAKEIELTWPAAFGVLILRQMKVEDPYTGFLAGTSTGPIAITGGDALGPWATFGAYIPVGFDHIIPKGLDHILFVLGLFFLSTRMGPLLWQVSAFTLAHTVTLALGALGIVNVPGTIVEPIIAASIVYVAIENVVSDGLNRWRPMVIFGFGLLHGLGFASVLGEFGMPQAQFVPALIGFNIGVEIGQLAVIALAFLLVVLAQRVDAGRADLRTGQMVYGGLALVFAVGGILLNGPDFVAAMGTGAPVFLWPMAGLCLLCLISASLVDHVDAYRRYVAVPASLAIAAVGAFWFVERVFL